MAKEFSLKQLLIDHHQKKNVACNIQNQWEKKLEPYKNSLRCHQIKGIQWMHVREQNEKQGVKGGILHFAMGLGKTYLALCYDLLHPFSGPLLVICTLSTINSWTRELKKWKPFQKYKVLVWHPNRNRQAYELITKEELKEYDIVISTYASVRSAFTTKAKKNTNKGKCLFFLMQWRRIYADESHNMRNPYSKTQKSMLQLQSHTGKFCLTGTMRQNYDSDVFAQLQFCGYHGLLKDFNVRLFKQHHLGDLILYCDYEKAGIQMPPLHFKTVVVEFTPEHWELYATFKHLTEYVVEQNNQKILNFGCVLAMFTRLREVCIAPYLIYPHNNPKEEETRIKIKKQEDNNNIWENLVQDPKIKEKKKAEYEKLEKLTKWLSDKNGTAGLESPKLKVCAWLIESHEQIPENEKIIVFTTYNGTLRLLYEKLEQDGYEDHVVYVHGKMKSIEREYWWNEYKINKKRRVLLMTYKIGSDGLNLPEANHVILLDGWWSPSTENQAISRMYRLDQIQTMYVWRLILKNSIDEYVRLVGNNKNKKEKEFQQISEQFCDEMMPCTKKPKKQLQFITDILTSN